MQSLKPTDARGIDVSENNGVIDWSKVRNIDFCFAKATEGETYHDSQFAANYKGMKDNGILRGAYNFVRPLTSSAEAAAKAFVDVVKANGGFDELPPMLDLEDKAAAEPLGRAGIVKYAHDWIATVANLTNRQPVLYTYLAYFRDYLDDSFTNVPIFLADYGVAAPADVHNITDWTFWQHADHGSVPGINGNVDLDVYSGTVETLKELCGISTLPVVSPTAPKPEASVVHSDKHPLLERGSNGEAVKQVQRIVGAYPVDGLFGPETERCVRRFQSSHGLRTDGIVGQNTWATLLGVHKKMPTLMIGDIGGNVRHLQHIIGTHPVDGIFGVETLRRVELYQVQHHVQVDGIVGPQTWGSLLS